MAGLSVIVKSVSSSEIHAITSKQKKSMSYFYERLRVATKTSQHLNSVKYSLVWSVSMLNHNSNSKLPSPSLPSPQPCGIKSSSLSYRLLSLSSVYSRYSYRSNFISAPTKTNSQEPSSEHYPGGTLNLKSYHQIRRSRSRTSISSSSYHHKMSSSMNFYTCSSKSMALKCVTSFGKIIGCSSRGRYSQMNW